MQSKHQICLLLESAGVRPNKRLGQHFLIDLNLMRLLINSADIHPDDVVLEVGCGTGSLTAGVAEKAGCCIAVEIDRTLAQIAQTQLADRQNVKIINADVLENKNAINRAVITALEQARDRHQGRLLLVANLPYNVASPLIINLVIGPTPASCCRKTAAGADAMFVTVQKEVASRMTAPPGCKDYGTMSILLAATGELKTIRILKPSVFWPQPKVDSALVSYVRNAEKLRKIKSVEMLSRVAGAFLRHRRKMLKGCCKLMTGELAKVTDWLDIFSRCGIDPTLRPDQLAPEQYVSLANLCCKS
jgi:16S rRNA (adenine1518-N6/adenine1519-N6)-dimethyltransferase